MGLLFRQVHHWAANIFIATLLCHMVRIFVTGAFRKPRDINWMIGLTLFLLSVFNGFTGYSLPGDLMSGIGLRIAYSIALSVPVLGNWLTYLLFGGQFPSDQLTHRLFIAHVFIVPLLLLGLLGVHLGLVWHQKHTQFPGRGRTERRLVGSQLWPTYTARSVALLCGLTGVVVVLSGVAQINPIWEYGPYHPGAISSFAQPDWYVGWLEGSLRLFPAWRLHIFGYAVSVNFWPGVMFPIVTFAILYSWPALERFMTGDIFIHNVLDRPRDRPVRTAVCVGALTFYLVVYVAGAQDVLAFYLNTTQPPVTLALRGLAIGLPVAAGVLTWRICRGLAETGRLPATEPPKGPHTSETPAAAKYLPSRARFEEADEVGELEHQ
jgi:ubiquinol-cytochrome c reductase cytochrome b subunit